MTIRTTSAAFALLAAVALAGCSSSDSGDDTPPPAPKAPADGGKTSTVEPTDSKAALVTAVKAYSTAYFKPDADAARALLSDRCKAKAPDAAYKAALQDAVDTYGHQTVKSVTVDRLSGDVAVVSYTYSVPALDQKGQAWVREGSGWRYDAC
jgi:hypothetical protein